MASGTGRDRAERALRSGAEEKGRVIQMPCLSGCGGHRELLELLPVPPD